MKRYVRKGVPSCHRRGVWLEVSGAAKLRLAEPDLYPTMLAMEVTSTLVDDQIRTRAVNKTLEKTPTMAFLLRVILRRYANPSRNFSRHYETSRKFVDSRASPKPSPTTSTWTARVPAATRRHSITSSPGPGPLCQPRAAAGAGAELGPAPGSPAPCRCWWTPWWAASSGQVLLSVSALQVTYYDCRQTSFKKIRSS